MEDTSLHNSFVAICRDKSGSLQTDTVNLLKEEGL